MAARNVDGQHGYDASFVDELDQKYMCPVCLLALKDPVQTKCGHRFCKLCLRRSCGSMRFSKCPVDNIWLDTIKGTFEDVAMKREVLSLAVRCVNVSDGCQWRGELRHQREHSSQCPETTLACINDCGVSCRRRDLDHHLVTCPQRVEDCPHCHSQVVVAEMIKHQLLTCPRFPVKCNICHALSVRSEIPRHTDQVIGDCPLVIVKCSFHQLGCHYQDKRKNMADHYRTSCPRHMELMTARIVQHTDLLQKQDTQLKRLFQTCSHLTELSARQHRLLEEHGVVLLSHASSLHDLEYSGSGGSFLWKINLPDENTCHIRSPAFYTGRPGYRLSLTLELAGYRDYNQIYASIFVNLEKGMYDNQLKFPFEGLCHVTLFDQQVPARGRDSRENFTTHVVCSHVPRCLTDDVSQSQQRGRLKFMPTTELLGGRFVHQGALLLQVDTSNVLVPESGL